MSPLTINKIRNRVWHSISPQVANQANLTIQNLQQFIAGTFMPSDLQLQQLANCLGVKL